jgi:DNA-binding MarR family transcriptional regulator/catechol 2,3-dioxygenase-like lactoylglutathione lyase family enzyme
MDLSDVDFLATPTLMRAARGVYASSIRAELHSIGIEDMPRNGAFILAGVDRTGGPRQDLSSELGVSKQAVSQLVDALVSRGYVERGPDTEDRRRINLELTERGREAAAAVYRGVEAVDAQLEQRVAAEQVEAMRSALFALAGIKIANIESGAARPRLSRQLRAFSPIFPVADLPKALEHYSALGFKTLAYAGGEEYGFADRDRTGLHLAAHAGHDPARGAGSAYLYVRDADALYEEWSRPGIGGQTRPVGPTPYKLREGSHVDPDGNLIRFGSPMEE